MRDLLFFGEVFQRKISISLKKTRVSDVMLNVAQGREIGIEAKFTTKLSGFNYFLTAANVFFVIAHLVITHSKSKLRYLDIYATA